MRGLEDRWAAFETESPLLASAIKLAVLFVVERRAKSARRSDPETLRNGAGVK